MGTFSEQGINGMENDNLSENDITFFEKISNTNTINFWIRLTTSPTSLGRKKKIGQKIIREKLRV